ncbi:MAG: NPCBM/NEW2 domain-containing protein [Planctomycetota bacterium]|nr:NPCBM/NEW2 domain-containing protein [Planctomycetota bacterium]MDA0932720.1 NPCBM/NEW2 domain-containing protein [Planctomycetota bacterium]
MRAVLAWIPVAGLLASVPAQQVTLRSIAGEQIAGARVAVGDDQVAVTRADGSTVELSLDEVESVSCNGQRPLTSKGPGRVWLRSGADFGAELVGAEGGSARLDVGFEAPISLGLVHLRALRFEAASAAPADSGFEDALASPPETTDLLFAWNRNSGKLTRLSVRVIALEEGRLRVDYRGERTVPLDQIHGLVFGVESGLVPVAPPAPSVRVLLAAGGPSLIARWTGAGDGRASFTLAEGPQVSLGFDQIDRIDVRSSRVQRLDAMAPVAVEQVPAFDVVRPFLVGEAPGGPGFVLGDREHVRGLCLFPRSRLTWSIDARAFDVFETTIGIDGRSTGPADAVFRILLDDTVLVERQHVTGGFVESVRVPLGAGNRLTLEVDFGERFDLGDHCVFADPRLLKL